MLLVLFSPASFANDCVVLLHGLGRSNHSMRALAIALEKEGYAVVNAGYPSTKHAILELSAVVGDGVTRCQKLTTGNIHFVTHSLGGILVRQYFQDHVVPAAKRMVMLSPPNHGSEIATRYKETWWYQWATGPAGQELGLEETSRPNQLKPVSLEIGIITGTKNLEPWFSGVVAQPNDGKVSVASARLAEMKDFITVPYSHTFIANAEVVVGQVLQFLAHGSFSHEGELKPVS